MGWHKKNDDSRRRKYLMMERILARPNLLQAIKRVEENKGSHGVDQMTTKDPVKHYVENRTSDLTLTRSGTYQPKHAGRVEIPNPNVGIRKLGIPTVTDRFIHQAIAQQSTLVFDQTFTEVS